MILTDINTLKKSRIAVAEDVFCIEKSCFAIPWSLRSVETQIFNGNAVFAAVYEGDSIAGYITGQIAADECELYRIAVLPQYRKQHIGDMLMKYFFDQCEKHNVKSIFLEVRSSNLPARRLYEKSGFRVLAVRKNYYSEPAEDAMIYGFKYSQ